MRENTRSMFKNLLCSQYWNIFYFLIKTLPIKMLWLILILGCFYHKYLESRICHCISRRAFSLMFLLLTTEVSPGPHSFFSMPLQNRVLMDCGNSQLQVAQGMEFFWKQRWPINKCKTYYFYPSCLQINLPKKSWLVVGIQTLFFSKVTCESVFLQQSPWSTKESILANPQIYRTWLKPSGEFLCGAVCSSSPPQLRGSWWLW